jgi:uncharacterized protein (DUF433 family)
MPLENKADTLLPCSVKGLAQVARLDPRLVPAYSIAQASHYLRIPAPTVRSWVLGRDYPRTTGTARFQPVVPASGDAVPRLSFQRLIELAALRALRTEHGFKLSAVREALHYARRELNVERLLCSKDLYARAGDLFLQRYGQLINLNRAGQLGIQAVLQGLLQRIEWRRGSPVRFFPVPPNRPDAKSIVLDPRLSFGRPVLASAGVSTSVIVDRVNAGESADSLAEDYGVGREEIMDALAYERAA